MMDQTLLGDFVKWSNLYDNRKKLVRKYADTESDVELECLQGNEDQIAALELELMSFSEPLQRE